jgi:hypothetical protein
MAPDPAIFVLDLKDANRTLPIFSQFSAYYFLCTFTSFFKIKRQKKNHKTVGIEVFLTIFA